MTSSTALVRQGIWPDAANDIIIGTQELGLIAGNVPTENGPYDTVSLPLASPGVVIWPGVSLPAGTAIVFNANGGTLPTGVTGGTSYFVAAGTIGPNSLSISDTRAHALAGTNLINFTGTTSGSAWVSPAEVTVTTTAATPAVWTLTAHGMPAGTAVAFWAATTTPTGMKAGLVYYVSAGSTLLANTFTISDTLAHALAGTNQVALSDTGTGTLSMAVVDQNLIINLPTALGGGLSVVSTVGGAFAGLTFSSTSATPAVISVTAHQFLAGQAVQFKSSASVPTGLTAGTTFYVAQTANLITGKFSVADTAAHAIAGTNLITTSDTGSGTLTVIPVTSNGDVDINMPNSVVLPGQGTARKTLVFNAQVTSGATLYVFPPLTGTIYGSNSTNRTTTTNTAWQEAAAYNIGPNKVVEFTSADGIGWYAFGG